MDKFLRFLGLTQKAGHIVAGGNLTEVALKKGKLALVIISQDAAEGTRDKFQAMAKSHGVEVLIAATTDELGQAIGKGQISVLGIADRRMSEQLKELCIAM